MLLLTIFCIKKCKTIRKRRTFFWDSPARLDLSLNSQIPSNTYWHFPGLLQLQSVFSYFLLLLGKKTKIIIFCTKFQEKQAEFLLSKRTSLLLRSKSVEQNYLQFLKKFQIFLRVLRSNEAKFTSRNAFINNASALENVGQSENDKGAPFPDSARSLHLSLNPKLPNNVYWRFSGLLQFQALFRYFLCLLEKKYIIRK